MRKNMASAMLSCMLSSVKWQISVKGGHDEAAARKKSLFPNIGMAQINPNE